MLTAVCREMVIEFEAILLPTEIVWFSGGKALLRVYKLRMEMEEILGKIVKSVCFLSSKQCMGSKVSLLD